MFGWLKKISLMGTSYEYQTVPEAPPAPLRAVPLYQAEPDLERFEARVKEHRRRDARSEVQALPRSVIDALVEADRLIPSNDAAVRRAQALRAEMADYPVLPKTSSIPIPSFEEPEQVDRAIGASISIVPVMRRRR
jgi:hypothetical protein